MANGDNVATGNIILLAIGTVLSAVGIKINMNRKKANDKVLIMQQIESNRLEVKNDLKEYNKGHEDRLIKFMDDNKREHREIFDKINAMPLQIKQLLKE